MKKYLILSSMFLTQVFPSNAIVLENEDAHHISCTIKGVLSDKTEIFELKDIDIPISGKKDIGIRHEVEKLLKEVKKTHMSGDVFVISTSPSVKDAKKVIFHVTEKTDHSQIMELENTHFKVPLSQ